MTRADVVIVVPPFAPACYPSLGGEIVAAGCRDAGLRTEVFYANLMFAADVGYERYQNVATSRIECLVGEAIFAAYAFPAKGEGPQPVDAIDAAFGVSASIPASSSCREGLTPEEARYCHTRADAFLEDAVRRILSLEPRIVGFSSVFQQNLSSSSMLRRLKLRSPQLVTVLGGGNTSQPMGAALADAMDSCDFVFSGEADFAFPEFCERLLREGLRPDTRVIECPMSRNLDGVPRPDYQAYYMQLSEYVASGRLPDSLPECLHFESSRGCWYGAKNHCKFCGLNGLEISHRRKPSHTLLIEIRDLAERWRPPLLSATDNIMPIELAEEVLPSLEDDPIETEIFYEVKSNLREHDLDRFVLSGVRHLQPGIESLATNVLRQMAKGVSALQNVWLLRECQSRNVVVYWNLLTGVPRETRADYEAMIAIIPALFHLPPPTGVGEIRFDRYSPYFEQAAAHGITNLRPFPVYDALYPDTARKDDIAYHFVGDYRTEYVDDSLLQGEFNTLVHAWRDAWNGQQGPPRLFLQRLGPDHLLVQDSRPCALDTYFVVSGEQADPLLAFARPTRVDRVPAEWSSDIEELLKRRFVVEHEHHFVSVVTDPARGIELSHRRDQNIERRKLLATRVDRSGGRDRGLA